MSISRYLCFAVICISVKLQAKVLIKGKCLVNFNVFNKIKSRVKHCYSGLKSMLCKRPSTWSRFKKTVKKRNSLHFWTDQSIYWYENSENLLIISICGSSPRIQRQERRGLNTMLELWTWCWFNFIKLSWKERKGGMWNSSKRKGITYLFHQIVYT